MREEMSENEHGVFWALKELFAQHSEGCYPFDQATFEEVVDGDIETK